MPSHFSDLVPESESDRKGKTRLTKTETTTMPIIS